jgi:hypothetical protein
MDESAFAEFQTDHLMLLMGTNPLPNYVAANLLMRPETRLHLVVTTEIMQAKTDRTLIKLLGRDPADAQQYLEVSSSDPASIFKRVREQVEKWPGSWGLHYTGGKKSMVAHAYRAVEAALAKRHEQAIYSYLDADTLEMVIETPRYSAVQRLTAHHRVDVSIAQLLEMYGRPLSDKPTERPITRVDPDRQVTCKNLVDSCQVPSQRELWSCWAGTLRHNSQPLKDSEARQIEVPPDLQKILGGATIADLEMPWRLKASEISDWLHGDWLEDYVLGIIDAHRAEWQVTDLGRSIKPKGIAEFEVDVVAMQGYRMLAFSVTTDADLGRYHLNKSKLLEAVVRAEQMGGGESRVALVTFKDKVAGLQNQVSEVWGDRCRPRIRVFGLSQLPVLDQHLEAWFKEN